MNIIQGALELRTKVVEEAMTKIEDCYMVDISSTLNFEVFIVLGRHLSCY